MDDRKNIHRELADGFRMVHHKMPLWVLVLILIVRYLYLWPTTPLTSSSYFILSGVLAYILSSVINKLQSLGLKRKVAVILLYICLISLLIGAEVAALPLFAAGNQEFLREGP